MTAQGQERLTDCEKAGWALLVPLLVPVVSLGFGAPWGGR